MKVYLVGEDRSYGDWEVVGVCSTKEKAELAIAGMTRYDCAASVYTTKEFELDGVLNEVKGQLEQEVKELKECESLLKQLNELGS